MRIIKTYIQEQWEQNYKKEEFITKITDQILSICKFDENFNIGDKRNIIDEDMLNTKNKISNKDKLLEKSNEMRKTLTEKITELENENFRIKVTLLESLGVEL